VITIVIEVKEETNDYNVTLPGLQYTGKGDKLKAIESIIVKLEATLTGFLEVLEKA